MIEAALTVVEEHGVTALTLDAVAAQAGVTKRGLIYHFPTKHALVTGIHEELAARTEAVLIAETGREPEDASLVERTRGYVRAMLRSASTVEMRLILEAGNEPDWITPWERVYRRWFPEEERSPSELDELALRCLTARMAADGSWAYQSVLSSPLTPESLDRLIASILSPLDDE
ncbi:hypothetical protein AXK56_07945 [Tsukamurella pulmonis]|nr:hypothetical protein AXK56_07945 [Tsukamurella pulmonis]